MSSLYRLVYTSFRKPHCDQKEIENILNSCKRNNSQNMITGVLLHSNSRFIQYLEGGKDDIRALFNLIKEDPRHTTVNERNFESIKERVFPTWEMGYKDFDRVQFNTVPLKEEEDIFNNIISGDLDFDDNAMRIVQLFFKMA
ncbi:BLUF domain-containing protein [Ekhidna sp.]